MRPIDEQLRHLLNEGVEPVTADEIRRLVESRAPERRTVRRSALVGGAIAVLVIAGATIALTGGSEQHEVAAPSGPRQVNDGSRPGVVVAVTSNAELVELESLDGSQRRVIRNHLLGRAGISVRPDGSEVFVEGVTQPSCSGSSPADAGPAVARLDLKTGEIRMVDLGKGTRVATAADWSPDGMSYAYLGIRCNEQTEIVVRDVSGGSRRIAGTPESFGPAPIGWDGDGRHLLVLSQGPGRVDEWWIVDTTKSGTLKERGTLVPSAGNLGTFDLHPLGATGKWVTLIGDPRAGQVPTLSTFDVTRGVVTDTLLEWRDLPSNVSVRIQDSDASGRHLLLSTFVEGGPGFSLFRWSVGDDQPVKLADGIGAAAWLDGSDATSHDQTIERQAPTGWTTVNDDLNGFSAFVPDDWVQIPGAAPFELLSVMTSETVTFCDGSSTNTAFLTVHELQGGVTPPETPRPVSFGPSSGMTYADSAAVVNGDCPVPPSTAQNIFFTEGDRALQVMIRFYPEATALRRQQAYEILNSMAIVPEKDLARGRPASDVRVFILNRSNEQGAGADARNALAAFGYDVVGKRSASPVPVTTVTCIEPHGDDAGPLARALGADAYVTRSSEHAPKNVKGADCVVIIGKIGRFRFSGLSGPPFFGPSLV